MTEIPELLVAPGMGVHQKSVLSLLSEASSSGQEVVNGSGEGMMSEALPT